MRTPSQEYFTCNVGVGSAWTFVVNAGSPIHIAVAVVHGGFDGALSLVGGIRNLPSVLFVCNVHRVVVDIHEVIG
jgi:hypothetical protein